GGGSGGGGGPVWAARCPAVGRRGRGCAAAWRRVGRRIGRNGCSLPLAGALLRQTVLPACRDRLFGPRQQLFRLLGSRRAWIETQERREILLGAPQGLRVIALRVKEHRRSAEQAVRAVCGNLQPSPVPAHPAR